MISFLKEILLPLAEEDFILQKRNDNRNDQTLLDLNYDESDIIRDIIGLKIEEYVYTTEDKVKPHEAPYRVFHKKIQNKEIYIKIKIKKLKKTFVFCMSFHEAKYPARHFPYG